MSETNIKDSEITQKIIKKFVYIDIEKYKII